MRSKDTVNNQVSQENAIISNEGNNPLSVNCDVTTQPRVNTSSINSVSVEFNDDIESDDTSLLEDIDMNKSVSELSVDDLVKLIQTIANPINAKIEKMGNKIEKKYKTVDNKITLLETDLKENQSKIETLTQIIVNMQSSINSINSAKRVNNVIISGLSEEDIMYNNTTLATDDEKMTYLFQIMGLRITEEQVNDFEISRIGQPRPNRSRLIKMNVKSKEVRKSILEKSPSLKTSNPPWNKVFVKKDLHPVYIKENQRIHKKLKILRKL